MLVLSFHPEGCTVCKSHAPFFLFVPSNTASRQSVFTVTHGAKWVSSRHSTEYPFPLSKELSGSWVRETGMLGPVRGRSGRDGPLFPTPAFCALRSCTFSPFFSLLTPSFSSVFSGRSPCVCADLEDWLTKLLDFYLYERRRHSVESEFILGKGASNHTNYVQRQCFRIRSEAFFPLFFLRISSRRRYHWPASTGLQRENSHWKIGEWSSLGRNTSALLLCRWHRRRISAGVRSRRSESMVQVQPVKHSQGWER